ncbi:MAG: glycoside hydrolase family 31 protein [Armatimonadota bacterium]|nr:glycoside hydrolase family 31 protein [Armatimonadota bacterium]MDR7455604.1 glycoside hydrolase family 31 protein [Armatimonadota bacterium]MDR7457627.1 glycoside hydrolase family 31 protein [Armatimonadota bacterium]MDR7496526.1 glycoside hydrolase family 31 protein [Armatimonadota bacterium]MDR7511320.1 glycoside hydrolase family 31 protein [Armatimonadota bacterium]
MRANVGLEPGSLRPLETFTLRASTSDGARLATAPADLEVSAYAPGIFRVRGLARGCAPGPDYGVLVGRAERSGRVRVTAAAGAVRLEATGPDGAPLALEVDSTPVRVRLVRGGRTLLESSTDGHLRGGLRLPTLALEGDAAPGWWAAFALRSGEPVYGLGEGFGPLNRRGQLVTSWVADALGVNSALSYKHAPFAWSPEGWGLFVHTTARVHHGVGYPQWSQRSYVVRVEEPVLDLFLMAGEEPAAILERYTWLTGRASLPPRWSYGAWMSRAWYRTAAEALDAARGLRTRRIPCDVLTLDGRAWLVVETRFGFEWDRARYPDPEAFARELHALGLRLCVWEYPYVSVHNPLFQDLADRGYLLRTAGGAPYVYEWDPRPFGTLLSQLPPSGIVDFTNAEAAAWYRDAHRKLFAQGVDVLKSDFGEQVPEDAVASNGDRGARLHNAYPLLYNRCVFEATEEHAPGAALVWARSGWAGSQRYPIQWGGDPQSDWEGLAASIRGGLSWGASGAPFYSHDIGGFYHTTPAALPDPELYIRWAQAGVLCSHTRFHGTSPREPWHYGDDAERIVRDWLRWRYRLIPYLQACALEAHRLGLPVMRAMAVAFPYDRASWAFEQQYLLGPSLLVAPVVVPGGRVQVYLPTGGWYEVPTGVRHQGPAVLDLTVPIDRAPIFGREGYLLPLGPEVQHTGELGPDPHVEEVWAFGPPAQPLELPGMSLSADLGTMPSGVHLRRW